MKLCLLIHKITTYVMYKQRNTFVGSQNAAITNATLGRPLY